MLSGTHARACVTMVSRVAKILYLSVPKLSLGIHDQNFAGDLVVLSHTRSHGQRMPSWTKINIPGKGSIVSGLVRRLCNGSQPWFITSADKGGLFNSRPPVENRKRNILHSSQLPHLSSNTHTFLLNIPISENAIVAPTVPAPMTATLEAVGVGIVASVAYEAICCWCLYCRSSDNFPGFGRSLVFVAVAIDRRDVKLLCTAAHIDVCLRWWTNVLALT